MMQMCNLLASRQVHNKAKMNIAAFWLLSIFPEKLCWMFLREQPGNMTGDRHLVQIYIVSRKLGEYKPV